MRKHGAIVGFIILIPSFIAFAQTGQTASEPDSAAGSQPAFLAEPDLFLKAWKEKDALISAIANPESQPGWDNLTGLQKDIKTTEYKKKIEEAKAVRDAIKSAAIGQKISWAVTISDVTKSKSPEGVVLSTKANRETNVFALFPLSQVDSLSKLTRGDKVRLSGKISSVVPPGASTNADQTSGLFMNVSLFGDSVEFLGKSDSSSDQSNLQAKPSANQAASSAPAANPASRPAYLSDPDILAKVWDEKEQEIIAKDPTKNLFWTGTELQKQEQIAEWKKDMEAAKAFRDGLKTESSGQPVSWVASVSDVEKSNAGDGIVLKSFSKGGARILMLFPITFMESLGKLSAGNIVKLNGKVKDIQSFAPSPRLIQETSFPTIVLSGESCEVLSPEDAAKAEMNRPVEDIVILVRNTAAMVNFADAVKKQLMKNLASLAPSQRYILIFWRDGSMKEGPGKTFTFSTKDNLEKASSFMNSLPIPEGKTNPVPALDRALQLLRASQTPKKRIVFLTSGSVFEDEKAIPKYAAQARAAKIIIDVVAFEGEDVAKRLSGLAVPTGGSSFFMSLKSE